MKKIRITIETERLLVLSRRRSFESWCPSCGSVVQRLTVDEAAAVARVNSLTVYRSVEAGTIHFVQTEAGVPLICAVSLGDLGQPETDEPLSIRLSPL